MKSRNPLKEFVQNVLGCTCPDKVFGQIEHRMVDSTFSPHTRKITIGERLLIYVWEADDPMDLQQGLVAMLKTGKAERDDSGLNRFRAVLAVEDPQNVAPLAEQYFSLFADRDDRMHMHVVPLQNLQNFFPEAK
ncbi:hypothetical protein ACFLZ5_05020 [Thermodesulfobacteriota bacterium]